jgi:hypothetical protein
LHRSAKVGLDDRNALARLAQSDRKIAHDRGLAFARNRANDGDAAWRRVKREQLNVRS